MEAYICPLHDFLKHPAVYFLQFVGVLIFIILALGWAAAARVRKKGAAREKYLLKQAEQANHLPKISVILPVKGKNEKSIENWASQLKTKYVGPMEFLFVLEDDKDSALPLISSLVREFYSHPPPGKCVRIVFAGYATTSSQKIWNQMTGVKAIANDTKFVLFLDDDIMLRPSTVPAFVAEMEGRSDIFILTGYPLDVPNPASMGTYCALAFHLPLSIGFSTGGATTFVWGGCMMMRAEDWRENSHGLVTALENGGYSDDMTLAAIASASKQLVVVPSYAVFEHDMSPGWSLRRYWNYLRRQTYVLETYSSLFNCVLNRVLLVMHSLLSMGFTFPLFIACLHSLALVYLSVLPSIPGECQGDMDALGLGLVGMYLVSMWIALVSLRSMIYSSLGVIFPENSKQRETCYHKFCPVRMMLGLTVSNVLYPLCALFTCLTPFIEWSGKVYERRNGRVKCLSNERLVERRWNKCS